MGEFIEAACQSEISEKNKPLRIKYCIRHLNFNFRRVLFSDESTFQLNVNNQKIFRARGITPFKKENSIQIIK